MMFKKFWKELLLVLLLTTALTLAVDFIPIDTTVENVFSTPILAIGIGIMLLPIIPAAIGGYLISKKSYHKTHSLLIPGIGTALAAILLFGIAFMQISYLTEAGWQSEYQKVKELDVGFFKDMSLTEFKEFTLNSVMLGVPFLALINLGLGVLGGLIGNYFYMKKGR